MFGLALLMKVPASGFAKGNDARIVSCSAFATKWINAKNRE
jgi:hypothetical protein